jgi:DNA-binding Lrp family transcriptional regulator
MEEKILQVFLYAHKAKFSEIEKQLNIRSNKLAYHIKNLEKKGILVKEKDFYKLSDTAEHLIPYLSKKKHALTVLLIHIGDKKQCFLYERKKRPFKDRLSLPGGRMLLKEDISKATKRLSKKFGIDVKLKKMHSVSIEHVKKSGKIIQTDVIVFVSATTKDKIKLTNIQKNKSKIIPSDYKLLKNDLDNEIEIKILKTKDS